MKELTAAEVNWKVRESEEKRERAELKFLTRHACDRIRALRKRGAPEAMVLRIKLDLVQYSGRIYEIDCGGGIDRGRMHE